MTGGKEQMSNPSPIEAIDAVLTRGKAAPQAASTGTLYESAISRWAGGSMYSDEVERIHKRSMARGAGGAITPSDVGELRALLENVRWEFEQGTRSDPYEPAFFGSADD